MLSYLLTTTFGPIQGLYQIMQAHKKEEKKFQFFKQYHRPILALQQTFEVLVGLQLL